MHQYIKSIALNILIQIPLLFSETFDSSCPKCLNIFFLYTLKEIIISPETTVGEYSEMLLVVGGNVNQ